MREGMNQQQTEPRARRIAIYTGIGTSHSWLWFVDVLERMEFNNLTFVDEGVLRQDGGIVKMDAFLLSGGDTFAIAEGMAEKGTKNLRRFVEGGGTYFGSCAGAYLPLNSSKYPLNLLNLAAVKISNLSKYRPEKLLDSEKFCTPYGCDYVFHPVRDEVKVRCVNGYHSVETEEITAPLYGGPCMEPSGDVTPIAFYHGFTGKTIFLVDEELARETVVGKMAVCSKRVGRGKMYLSGPHLEHPFYPEANQLLMEMLADGLKEKNVKLSENEIELDDDFEECRDLFKELKRELSEARIIALSLERESMTWLIGRKVYEPEKFRVFLEEIWRRLGMLERHSREDIPREDLTELFSYAKVVRERLKSLKRSMQDSSDSTVLAEEIINRLRKLTSSFMELYFGLKRREKRWEVNTNVHVL